MTGLPNGVEPYGQSPIFTAKTVPAKLLSVHDLKAGTWGRLNVMKGEVTYYLEGGVQDGVIIQAGHKHIIQPEERHYISVSEMCEFFIEFCAAKNETSKSSSTLE